MVYPARNHIPAIEECFRSWGEISGHPNEVQWDIESPNAPQLPVHASLVEDWLRLHADTGIQAENGRISAALKWNRGLDGAAKFSIRQQSRTIGLCGEIPLEYESDIMPGLAATLAGFEQAVLLIRDSSDGDSGAAPNPTGENPAQEPTPALQQLLAETDWPFTGRPDGSCMVELSSKDDFYQTLVKTEPDGCRRASVELASRETPASASRDALAVLLLTAAGVIRMVRPIIVEDSGDRMTMGFEICFSTDVSSSLLDRGFSSLSIACRLCGREAAALHNPRIAGEYLAVRHFNIE